jgi:hypothetical protein
MGLEKTNRQESKVENVKMFKDISTDKKISDNQIEKKQKKKETETEMRVPFK